MSDHVISNNLIVLGMSTFTGGQTFDGQMIVDLDNAEALLVRQDGDSGDVFVVDTNTPSATLPQANSFISLGDIPASAGVIRLSRFAAIEWRNSGNTNNLTVLTTDGSDVLFFGDTVVASIRVEPLIGGVVSTSWAGLNEAASGTNPTLIPNRAGTNTGIGATDNQAMDMIVNSVSRMHFGTTGIDVTDPLRGVNAGAYAALNEAASATNPTLIPNRADLTTGIGGISGEISLIVDSVEAVNIDSAGVVITGNLAVSGAGPHAIGGVTFGAVQLLIGSTFTSDGASDIASGLFHTPTIVGAPGDISALTGTTLTAGITTQTATESIANIAQLQINEPFITDNLTGDITNAQTLLITGAPTEGLSNFAIRVISGSVFFGGSLDVTGTTTTVGRIKTVTRQTTTYTVLVTDSVVFGNTDSAGFTATLPAGVSGQTLRIINSGSSGNQLTVAPDGSEDLLGVNSSFTLFDGEALDITYDSTDGWY